MITVGNPANGSTVGTSFSADGLTTNEAVVSAIIVVNGVGFNGTITLSGPPKWAATFSGVATGSGALFKVAGATEGAHTSNITVV